MASTRENDPENVHNILGRVGGLAVVDIVGTIVGAVLFSRATGYNMPMTIAGAFVVGELAHFYFEQDTPITEKITAVLE